MCLFLHLSLCVLHTEMPYACVHFCVFMSFFFFFLRRQCAACTHERKGNIVCSVSLYSGTYQLKGCCLDSLRWGYSVKKTSHSNVRALGEVFHHTSDYWKYHSWGFSRRHKPRTILWVFFFYILLQFTHISCSAIFLIFLVISHTQACYLPFHPSITAIIHTRLEHIAQPKIKFKKNIIEICYVTFVRDLQYINTYAPIIMYNVEKRLTELYSVC